METWHAEAVAMLDTEKVDAHHLLLLVGHFLLRRRDARGAMDGERGGVAGLGLCRTVCPVGALFKSSPVRAPTAPTASKAGGGRADRADRADRARGGLGARGRRLTFFARATRKMKIGRKCGSSRPKCGTPAARVVGLPKMASRRSAMATGVRP